MRTLRNLQFQISAITRVRKCYSPHKEGDTHTGFLVKYNVLTDWKEGCEAFQYVMEFRLMTFQATNEHRAMPQCIQDTDVTNL